MKKSFLGFLAPLLLAVVLPATAPAQISVGISVNVPPPELPVYEQPPIPADGYIWTPGYWAWDSQIQNYYWVPGTWVAPPQPAFLWTPGFWAVAGGAFLWHAGYWGPHVGFYGGVNYGHGYGGNGYEGGYWQGGHLYYNRSVNNIGSVHITNVYNKTVVNNVTVNRISYNGGDGIHAQPTAGEQAAARDHHVAATPAQQQHVQQARANPALRVSENNGRPPVAATPRPGEFTGSGVVGAHPGTLTVAHQDAPAKANPPHHTSQSPQSPQPQSRPAQPPQSRPPVEQQHAPAQNQAPHPSTPEAHPNPHAAEHGEEHGEHGHEH
jgi:hypothetical protein